MKMRKIVGAMKIFCTLNSILAAALFSGCATGDNGLVLDTVGSSGKPFVFVSAVYVVCHARWAGFERRIVFHFFVKNVRSVFQNHFSGAIIFAP
jgi:hypothetical protein